MEIQPAALRELVNAIRRDKEAALDIVEQLLLEERRLKATVTTRGDICQYIREYAPECNVLGDCSYIMDFSPDEIEALVDNLISNAQEAGANMITIRFVILGDRLHMTFADDGCGLYHKIERGTGKFAGIGFGLSHAKDVAQRHGGDVVFIGNSPGACFEVTFRQPLKRF